MVKSKMKLAPPDEELWDELGLEKRCTCSEYDWKTICPYGADVWDEANECECCPYHAEECRLNI